MFKLENFLMFLIVIIILSYCFLSVFYIKVMYVVFKCFKYIIIYFLILFLGGYFVNMIMNFMRMINGCYV